MTDKHDCPTHGDTTHHPDLITCDTCGNEWHYTQRDWPPRPPWLFTLFAKPDPQGIIVHNGRYYAYPSMTEISIKQADPQKMRRVDNR